MATATAPCSFVTTKGSPCRFKGRHEYDGKCLCERHHKHMKATEPCVICLDDMTSTRGRIQLSCGHYYHVACLGQVRSSTCPQCRVPLTPNECLEVFRGTQTDPLMMRFYTEVPTVDHGATMRLMNRLITIVSRTSRVVELDIIEGHLDMYERAVDVLAESVVRTREELNDMLLDIVMMGSSAIEYVREHNSYDGFMVMGENRTLLTDMAQVAPAPAVPEPIDPRVAPYMIHVPVPVPINVMGHDDVMFVSHWQNDQDMV